ncbi:MAG: triose-phosphate isomerase [Anaerolineales bacterium]
MRTPVVAANWKMNKTVEQARLLVVSMNLKLNDVKGVEKVICPPFTALLAISALLEGTDIGLGAQNMHWEESGAFTGEVAPSMVAEFCKYVIIGHSERRAFFGETDESVNRKLRAALAQDLVPIVCVGETLEENESGQTEAVVRRQIDQGLGGIEASGAEKLIVAYEPIWAIGTGRASSGDNANSVIANFLRPALADLFGAGVAQAIRVQYGGSVKASNAAEFFEQPEIDGALVGGASLKADEFVAITQAAAK